ncbi:hypothetical protein V1264_018151 [Littorina saxatilis]|uniref:NTF2 domain-containing protein n=1 Tax=Littorina saxatilis TaxID=31220 RepID=A0AAN9BBX2_9CAEN
MTQQSENMSELQKSFGQVSISASVGQRTVCVDAGHTSFSGSSAGDHDHGSRDGYGSGRRKTKNPKHRHSESRSSCVLYKKHGVSSRQLCVDQDGDAVMGRRDTDHWGLYQKEQLLYDLKCVNMQRKRSGGERYQPYCRKKRKDRQNSGNATQQLHLQCHAFSTSTSSSILKSGRKSHSGSTSIPNKAELYKVVTSRINTSLESLDLTGLYKDETLRDAGIFLPLSRNQIAVYIGKVIAVGMPGVEILNLSCNRLNSLKSVQEILKRAPNIRCLDLGKNCLRDVESLQKIKDCHLQELILRGNSLCSRFRSWSDYVSAVQQIFPHLTKLDGQELPQTVMFSGNRNILPALLASCLGNGTHQDLIVAFLQQYYSVYDSHSRQPLITAYHKDARFSLTVAANPLVEHRHTQFDAAYLRTNKNLIGYQNLPGKRKGHSKSQMKTGQHQIVSQLEALPRTTHYPCSFLVDITRLSDSVLCVVVRGVFRDFTKTADVSPLYAFTRCFIMAVGHAGGLSVINDLLSVTNASLAQQWQADKWASGHVGDKPPSLLSSLTSQMLATCVESATSQLHGLAVTKSVTHSSIAD